MVLYFLEPEVAGGHGEQTEYNPSWVMNDKPSTKVLYFHHVFDGWFGDDLLEATPVFIVSDRLRKRLVDSGLTGYRLDDCLISTSGEFNDWHPDVILPSFFRFIPTGRVEMHASDFSNWSGHDFSLTTKAELVVSEKALGFLKGSVIRYCTATILMEAV